MEEKKIAIVIYVTNTLAMKDCISALQMLRVPAGFTVEIIPLQSDNKYYAYNFAMKKSNAKYKIYIDDQVILQNENIVSEILKIFKSDETIGMIGCSGAIQLSTNGICVSSAKRCGKLQTGINGKNITDWRGIEGNYREVEVIDGYFIATQYDIPFREEFGNMSDSAQCMEFRRKKYKVVVAYQDRPYVWCKYNAWRITDDTRQKFLEEYSKDIFPLVTVIIPTFNRPKYFKAALESVLNQTYRHFEIIISDDSTIDDTEKLIQPYLEKYPFIKYFRNKGFTADDNYNFLRAYNNPDAEYVNWLMDDDLFYPTKFEKMIEVYRNNPDISLVTSSRHFIDSEGNITGSTSNLVKGDMKISGDEAARLLFQLDNYIGEPTTVLIRKKFLRDNDLCWSAEHTGFYPIIDVSTWCCLMSKGKFFRFSEELSAFRRHQGQGQNDIAFGPLCPVAYIDIFKIALEKKVFFHTAKEKRDAVFFLLQYTLSHLKRAHTYNYHNEKVQNLEKYFVSLAKTLYNGYKIELPKIKNKFNKTS